MKLLGDGLRWRLVAALAVSDRRVNELVEQVQQPANLVSYHLARLRASRLVVERRSSADARDVYYHLDLERLQAALRGSAAAIHPGLWPASPTTAASGRRPVRVLFLCTHNSARSQMAEAILRHHGADSVLARSAGSHPSRVHPLALRTLAELGVDAGGLESKPLDSVASQHFDYVITLCDKVREVCPGWPGEPELVHWSLADPSIVDASEEEAVLAFRRTAAELSRRVRYLLGALAGMPDDDAA